MRTLHYQLTKKSLRTMRKEKFKDVYATTTLTNFLLFSVEGVPMGALKKDTVEFELNLGKDVILEIAATRLE